MLSSAISNNAPWDEIIRLASIEGPLSVTDSYGNTPLHRVVIYNLETWLLGELMTPKSFVTKNNRGDTPLHIAVTRRRPLTVNH
jgi:ankyrin repeat protein